jgi:hypothetical protein
MVVGRITLTPYRAQKASIRKPLSTLPCRRTPDRSMQYCWARYYWLYTIRDERSLASEKVICLGFCTVETTAGRRKVGSCFRRDRSGRTHQGYEWEQHQTTPSSRYRPIYPWAFASTRQPFHQSGETVPGSAIMRFAVVSYHQGCIYDQYPKLGTSASSH